MRSGGCVEGAGSVCPPPLPLPPPPSPPPPQRFHLDNAFNLQLKRVDADWATHEQQMKNDYEAQVSRIHVSPPPFPAPP